MFKNLKLYIYGIITFIFTALIAWVKILSEQKQSLEKENLRQKEEIEQVQEHAEEIKDVVEEEREQQEIETNAEESKDAVENEVDSIIKDSKTQDIKVTL